MKKPAHPMQPIVIGRDEVARFHPNAIVQFLLDAGPFDLNQLALMKFSKQDREQFAQLIGYSVSGFGELSYASNAIYACSRSEVERLFKEKRKQRRK